jgi:hypothetical protein
MSLANPRDSEHRGEPGRCVAPCAVAAVPPSHFRGPRHLGVLGRCSTDIIHGLAEAPPSPVALFAHSVTLLGLVVTGKVEQ